MTLNELRYVVAVAEHRHFGKAARACCISQPTLSTQIKKLEAQLGVVLFERTNKSVRPTPVGDKVVRKARKVLDQIEDIRTLCGLCRTAIRKISSPQGSGGLTRSGLPAIGNKEATLPGGRDG